MDYLSHIILNEISYLAVLLAALANFAVGALWYSPLLFSKKWAEIVFRGQSFEEAVKGSSMALIFSMAFLVGFIQAFGFALVLWGNVSAFQGAVTGVFVSLLFIIPNLYKNSLFERRSFIYVLINGGHDLIVFMLMGMIIATMH